MWREPSEGFIRLTFNMTVFFDKDPVDLKRKKESTSEVSFRKASLIRKMLFLTFNYFAHDNTIIDHI